MRRIPDRPGMDISFSTPLKGFCKFVERMRNPDTVVLRCGEERKDEMNGGGSFCLRHRQSC